MVAAPDGLRGQLGARSAVRLAQAAAGLAPGPVTTPAAAARLGLGTLARRYQVLLSAELAVLEAGRDRLTGAAAPKLVALLWGRSDSAGALLVAAGDHPQRLRLDDDTLGLVVVEVGVVLQRSSVLGPHDLHRLSGQALELVELAFVDLESGDT